MKKLIALILCVLLAALPVLSLGETAHITVKWDANEDGTAAWLRAVGQTEASVEKLAPACADLMNTLGVDMTVDGDNYRANGVLTLDGWEAFGLSYDMSGENMLISMSMLTDAVISMPVGVDHDAPDAMTIAIQLIPVVMEALNKIPSETEEGYFVADAYTCTTRTTCVIIDSDLAELFDAMIAKLDGTGADAVVTELQYLKLILENANHSGKAILVEGLDEGVPQGITLTLLAESHPEYDVVTEDNVYLTISMNLDLNDFHAVARWAKADGNYTAQLSLKLIDAYTLDFALTVDRSNAVRENDGVKVNTESVMKLDGTVVSTESTLTLSAALTLANGNMLGSESVLTQEADTWILMTHVTSGADRVPAWTCTMTYTPCDSLPPMDVEGKTVLTEEAMYSTDLLDLTWAFELVGHLPQSVLRLIMGY